MLTTGATYAILYPERGKENPLNQKEKEAMKWIMVEIEWNGKEHEMPTKYDRREDAEKDRQIFYSVNPNKTCILRQVEE